MIKKIPGVFFCILLPAVSGCNQKIIKPNEQTGYYDTSQVLYDDDIRTVNYDLNHHDFKKLVFLETNSYYSDKTEFGKDPEIKQYFSMLNMFDQVVMREEMEKIVFSKGLHESIPNVSDLVAMHHLSKEIGNFFYVKYAQRFAGGYTYEGSLKVFNTSNGELLLHLYYKGYTILALPLINGFIDWMNGRKIKTNNKTRGKET